MDEWIKKMWHHYNETLATSRNGVVMHAFRSIMPRKKPDTKDPIFCASMYMKYRINKSVETESRLVVARG
jgi:hypothetical protein